MPKRKAPSRDAAKKQAMEDLKAAASYLINAGLQLINTDSEAMASLPLTFMQKKGARLLRVGTRIQQFLGERKARRAASLQHLLGIVGGPGNPGGESKWLPFGIERKREGWTVRELMARRNIKVEERVVRAGLASVRDEVDQIFASKAMDDDAAKRFAERKAQVERFNRENNIRTPGKRKPSP
jgi:hypothetical protein